MKKKIIIVFGVLAFTFIIWLGCIWLADLVVKFRVPVKLYTDMSVSSDGKQFVSAQGTWVFEDAKHAFPLNTVKIICTKRINICTSATGQIGMWNSLNTELDVFEILEWSSTRVVYEDNSATCTRYVYTIDLLTKSVNGFRQKRVNMQSNCTDVEDQVRLSLQDGRNVAQKLRNEAIPWYGRMAMLPFEFFN